MQLMTINSVLLWLVLLVNLFLTLAIIRRLNLNSGEPIEMLQVGQLAPDFVAETLTGEQVTLANYRGHALVLVFVSPTCGYCRQYIPELEAMNHKVERSDIQIILVSDSEITQTQTYAEELSITLPIISAPRSVSTFLADYKIGGVPFYVMIDSDQRVLSSGVLNDPRWRELSNKWRKEDLSTKTIATF